MGLAGNGYQGHEEPEAESASGAAHGGRTGSYPISPLSYSRRSVPSSETEKHSEEARACETGGNWAPLAARTEPNAKPRDKLKPQLGLKPHLPHSQLLTITTLLAPILHVMQHRVSPPARVPAHPLTFAPPACSPRLQTPPGASQPTSRAHYTSQASLAPMHAPSSSKSGRKVSSTDSCTGQTAICAQLVFGSGADNRHTGRYLFIH